MKAETVLNVIEALPPSERPRLLKMLGLGAPVKTVKKKQLLTDAEATDYLIKKLFTK